MVAMRGTTPGAIFGQKQEAVVAGRRAQTQERHPASVFQKVASVLWSLLSTQARYRFALLVRPNHAPLSMRISSRLAAAEFTFLARLAPTGRTTQRHRFSGYGRHGCHGHIVHLCSTGIWSIVTKQRKSGRVCTEERMAPQVGLEPTTLRLTVAGKPISTDDCGCIRSARNGRLSGVPRSIRVRPFTSVCCSGSPVFPRYRCRRIWRVQALSAWGTTPPFSPFALDFDGREVSAILVVRARGGTLQRCYGASWEGIDSATGMRE